MNILSRSVQTILLVLCLLTGTCLAADITTHELETELVPAPAQYDVLLPSDYTSSGKTYPLFLWLHGGGGPDGHLQSITPLLESMWSDGTLSELVVVTPHAGEYPNNYLDFADGSQRWESFITGELLDHLRDTYRIADDNSGTFIGGVSMGGLGSLRLGLKHLDTFSAIIAFEPQIRDSFDVPDFYEVDQAFHDRNQPANLVRDNTDAIRNSGIQIYFEVGSEDSLEFFLGANFLHNILFERQIRHEYRYVSGADHVGDSFAWRYPDGMAFLNRVINPPPHDPAAAAFRRAMENFDPANRN